MSEEEQQNGQHKEEVGEEAKIIHLDGLYEDWFLDYASYVILERAVPMLADGFKPVQRRIMHAMKEMDDGRFHKVANIIGSTMQFHPHGDAAIGDAIVKLGQKDLLIDMQGNWGDIRTGDRAAAPRYIEARLSKFALDVAFNPQTTDWQLSYDGRKKEPVTLPMKFPLVLAQGAEGIAVGLATKILPHNFNELLKACIDHLKGKSVKILPDFPTGGMADCSDYQRGKRGGKIKVRARIEIVDKDTLAIREIPFATTTTQLIDSIIKANDKGKIKVKKVVDNTAKDVEILIDLPKGVSPSVTMDALFAFTNCEMSISPNACVIVDDKPVFMNVHDMLRASVDQTVALLKRELEIRLGELQEKWHFSSLEKIFIENRIYRDIEECETWEAVIEAIDKGLEPFKKQLKREVTEDDIVRLTEIKIKRISKYDSFKADELLIKLEEEIKQVKHDLKHLTDYAIAYYQRIIEKYGKGRERRTELANFDTVEIREVVADNAKLYVDRKEGFIGMGREMKKAEFVTDCSDIDDVITFRADGSYSVTRISDKAFVGKDILHIGIWKKGDDRMTYNAIYRDGKTGKSFAKRFHVNAATRDRPYHVGSGSERSKLLHITANPNGEAEVVEIRLSQSCKARKKVFDYYFSELEIKGRGSRGNTVTKYPVRKVVVTEEGVSTLGGREIWLDEAVGKLNTDGHGKSLGSFLPEDLILQVFKNGEYMLNPVELTYRFPMHQLISVEKFDPGTVISAIHYSEAKKANYLKRFQIETTTTDTKFSFIGEGAKDKLVFATTADAPVISYTMYGAKKGSKEKSADLAALIDVKGWKAIGNKFAGGTIRTIKMTASQGEMEDSNESENSNASDTSEEVALSNEATAAAQSEESEKKESPKKKAKAEKKAPAKSSSKKKAPEIAREKQSPENPAEHKAETQKPTAEDSIDNSDIDFEITNLDGEQGELF